MRIESSVTSVSWIPSEVVSGLPKAAFAAGALHYDTPPPDVLGDVGARYHIIQNEAHVAFLDALVEESGAHFETAGVVLGRKVDVHAEIEPGSRG